MNDYQDSIRSCLQQTVTLHESVGHVKSLEHFVLEHGRPFIEVAPPRWFLPWMQKPRQCFSNSLQLTVVDRLRYVEGFAVLATVNLPVHHGWCLDGDGRVVDPTWGTRGVTYFGVPFKHAYAAARYEAQINKGRLIGSVIEIGDDDYALVQGRETRPWKAEVTAAPANADHGA